MAELVTFGETALRLSPPGTARLETTDDLEVYATGAASNVGITASRLGTDTLWVSKLADTPLGRRASAELLGHGIETDVTWVDPDRARQGLVFFERGSEPRDNFVLDDRLDTAIESAEPGELPMDDVQDADMVFVSGETLALSDTVVETTKAILRACGGQAVLGLDYRPGLWSKDEARETLREVFPAADVLIANEEEASKVLKKTGGPHEIAHGIASEWNFETVIITRSERGALAWHDSTIHERDALDAEAVDASGQHDALTGTFLHKRLDDADVGEALTYGVAAGTLTRTMPGPVPTLNTQEVEQMVAKNESNSGGASSGFR
jgi:2-dehydro-3-deoxygluconokinase